MGPRRKKTDYKKPPSWIVDVKGYGCRTIVLAEDDPEVEILHEPWTNSGFLLAPKIMGFPKFHFEHRRQYAN